MWQILPEESSSDQVYPLHQEKDKHLSAHSSLLRLEKSLSTVELNIQVYPEMVLLQELPLLP